MTVAARRLDLGLLGVPERFQVDNGFLRHVLDVGELSLDSVVRANRLHLDDLKGSWWRAYLEGVVPEPVQARHKIPVRTVDLFSGPGGLANGVKHLASEMGVELVPELIVDHDPDAARVYAANHAARRVSTRSVASYVDYALRETGGETRFLYPPELTDEAVHDAVQGVDMILAGPPCQGHSNLNNHTRRDDPRNGLYLTVPAFAVASGATMCIIENVPAVLHDSDNVVEKAERLFRSEGFEVESGVLNAGDLGWPQTRKRHFMVARRGVVPIPFEQILDVLAEPKPRSIWWAIHDLEDRESDDLMDEVPQLSKENVARIDWLFDNGEHDLGLPERPPSHRGGTTYVSVYGRLRKDEPSPTITTGFTSPGRGRYVHPTRRRVLTPREAARIQGFPDTYTFVVDRKAPPGRSKLAKWIGDAVPMPLGYAAAISAIAAAPIGK